MRPLYAVSDMLILPTRREGLATVIIEAAAAGVPTIAMDATGTRDVVENDVTGLLVTQGDVDEFVAAIGTLSGDSARRHRLGRSAQRDVLRRFSQPMVRDLWREFYLQTHDDT
ncbi:Lipid carrier : UDP-N-acetylgalactosaminyltransferase [Serinicoccus hydrothermalis]|uniref:D-inositol 3-phosphate glycosyltransferase n=1 Tax=Serinicoccus hydrothermalis TaxID=1758689 RepID=A0A1B1NEE2_9MICO|nr:Lipid carrier : UDP-N-acetylgalactosaminyltransferase [Serinicoccus hydrothermalis]